MEDFGEKEINFGYFPFHWVITIIGFLLFLSFLWLNRNTVQNNPGPRNSLRDKQSSICTSPSCARCGGPANLTQRVNRFEAFFSSVPDTDSSLELKDRIFSLISESVKNKANILSTVYTESGYELDLGEAVDTLPHIWMFPGLHRCTFWDPSIDETLCEMVSTFENPDNFEGVQKDFALVNSCAEGWKVNTVPAGKWRVYQLYDQGEEVDGNSSLCSFTLHLLMTVPLFMCQHVFGSAMFSVLEPGSSIEPHTGPCNYRLRCHLPLVTPPGYRIRVGRDTSVWKEGEMMVFDDSFVHEVWHEEEMDLKVRHTGGRVVLIFDIWHPHLTSEQRAAIKCIL